VRAGGRTYSDYSPVEATGYIMVADQGRRNTR